MLLRKCEFSTHISPAPILHMMMLCNVSALFVLCTCAKWCFYSLLSGYPCSSCFWAGNPLILLSLIAVFFSTPFIFSFGLHRHYPHLTDTHTQGGKRRTNLKIKIFFKRQNSTHYNQHKKNRSFREIPLRLKKTWFTNLDTHQGSPSLWVSPHQFQPTGDQK